MLFWVLAVVLLLVAGYTHYRFYKKDTTQSAKEKLELYLYETETEIVDVATDDQLLSALINLCSRSDLDERHLAQAQELVDKPYTLFIYNPRRELVYWSNDKAAKPDLELFNFNSPYYQIHQNLYRTVVYYQNLGDQIYQILGCIPVLLGQADHPYEHIDKELPSSVQLTTNPGVPILTRSGEEFIFINNTGAKRLTGKEIKIVLFLYILAFIAIATLIQKIAISIKTSMGTWQAVGFFIFTTLGVRLVTYLFNFADQFDNSEVFSQAITQPAFSHSLGNILINIALILWVTVFLINNIETKQLYDLKKSYKIAASFIGYLFIALGLLSLAKFCQGLIQRTNIDFNFESVFNLDKISILALVGIILLLFTLFIWSAKIISLIQNFDLPIKSRLGAGFAAVLASLPFALLFDTSIPLFQYALVAGIFILLLDIFLDVKTPNFTWIVLWLVVLSGFSSILMFKYNRDKDVLQRTLIAKSLSEEIDSVALNEIVSTVNAIEEPVHQVTAWIDIKSIINSTFRKNPSKYLETHYEITFPKASALKDSRELIYKDHKFYQRNDILDYYLLAIEGGEGIKVLTSFQKRKTNPFNPLPQFLPSPDFKDIPRLSNYEYAIYKDHRCVERSSSEYRMVLEEEIPVEGDISMIYGSGRSELLYNNGKYIVKIGKKLTGLIKPVSLFSYLFVIIVIIIFILLIINSAFPYLPEEFNFTLSNQISLRNKIQVSVLALIILSFIIIGIVTVFYFRNTAEKSYENKLKQNASSLQYEIQENIRLDNTEEIDSLLNEFIQSLAIKYNTHIQVFNPDGILLQSSDEKAVEAGVLKDRMDVVPLLNLKKFGESIDIHQNNRNRDNYYETAFFTLHSENNILLGFAGLPVFPGNTEAADSVKDFMGTLLNVYVFLLLIAGAFALAVANSITRPMTVLGQKLKEFKLGRSNEPLVWKSKDELGLLIQEYNQLIVKLDESADLLAVTEREVAWREMAKQVAHEIKNPLTPMRLSIQHLQHKMQNADPIESRQLVQRVGITLIEQIDNLSRIAAEFSTFAKMPKPQYERIILNDLVASVHDLFKKRDDMDFNLYEPIDEIYVNADRSHLLRVLNNLIKNAIQAIPGSRRGVIDIRLEKRNDKAVIQVCDNGKGISREMKDKVFYPNFTTKTSGTGLGLAISKNIIESFGGRIYFETEEGIGTKFYFELPLLRNTEEEFFREDLTATEI